MSYNGRFLESVRFRFAGDEGKAKQLITFARLLLGQLINDAGFNKLKQNYRQWRFKDGVVINVEFFHGIYQVGIYVPVIEREEGGVFEICTGFIVNIALVDEVPYHDSINVPQYALYGYVLEPSRDPDIRENWIRQAWRYNWDGDEFVGARNAYGFFEKDDRNRLYGEGDYMNAKDLTLRAFWQNTIATKAHGARQGSIAAGFPTPATVTDQTPGVIIDASQPAQLVAEQDLIYNFIMDALYPDTAETQELWHGGRYYQGSIDILATDNYLMSINGHVIADAEDKYQIESGDVILTGEQPFYDEITNPVMTGVEITNKSSLVLLPAGSTMTWGNLSNVGLWNDSKTFPITPGYDTNLYDPMVFPAPNGSPISPSQYHMPSGSYYVFSTHGYYTQNNYLDIGAGTIPENKDSGWYQFNLVTEDPLLMPRPIVPGMKVKVHIKLLGIHYTQSEYEFFATTGADSSNFKILVNTPILADSYEEMSGMFIEYTPDP